MSERVVIAVQSRDQAGPPDCGRMRAYYRFCQVVAQGLYVLYFGGRVYGAERVPRTGGVVLSCNHQSFLDPILATVALPRECHYMARDTLFHRAVFRRIIESLNAFPVKRGTSDIGAMKTSLARLAAGALITTFPEATRTKDGRVGFCRPGVILLARRARVPLVPMAIEGAYDVWPRHQKVPGRGRIWVEYGEPIPPETLREVPREEMARRVTATIRRIHNRLRCLAGRRPFEYAD